MHGLRRGLPVIDYEMTCGTCGVPGMMCENGHRYIPTGAEVSVIVLEPYASAPEMYRLLDSMLPDILMAHALLEDGDPHGRLSRLHHEARALLEQIKS